MPEFHGRKIKASERRVMAKRRQQSDEVHEGNTPSWDRFPGLTAEIPDVIDEYGDPATVSVDDLPALAADLLHHLPKP